MSRQKTTSKELGEGLFDFAIMNCQSFFKNLDEMKIKTKMITTEKKDVDQNELLIAYLWLIFHFLNVAGDEYEETTKNVHNAYASFLKLPQQETDMAMNHLFERYEEYRKNFSNNSKGGFRDVGADANFEKLSYSIANNILNKINIDIFFSFSLGVHMQQVAISLGNLLKEFKLTNQEKEDSKHSTETKSKQTKGDENDINFFRAHVVNSEIIEKNNGILPIKGWQVGQIILNDEDKTAKIEIRQTGDRDVKKNGAWYRVPYYGLGHLLCKNIEYKKVNTNIDGGVFLLFQDKNNTHKIKVMLNHNRQGIEIVCDKVSVIDFNNVKISIDDFKDIDIGCKIGKFFEIINK